MDCFKIDKTMFAPVVNPNDYLNGLNLLPNEKTQIFQLLNDGFIVNRVVKLPKNSIDIHSTKIYFTKNGIDGEVSMDIDREI